MKPHTTLCSKYLACPTCKSEEIVLIFFKHDKINEIINVIEQGKIKLASSDKENKIEWLCKNCFDVGDIVF